MGSKIENRKCKCGLQYCIKNEIPILPLRNKKGALVNFMGLKFCPKCGEEISIKISQEMIKEKNEIVMEIIKRVDNNNISIEDGEFTINGEVYSTKEVHSDYGCVFWGVSFDEYQGMSICEVFKGDTSLNSFILQKYTKRVMLENEKMFHVGLNNKGVIYFYEKCKQVKRINGNELFKNWVEV